MGAYHGKAGFDAFSHYRTVVGSDLPFSLTGSAAPPFKPGDAGLRRHDAAQGAQPDAPAAQTRVALLGLFARPPVVGLAGRAAHDHGPEHHRLGQLVAGQ